MFSVKPVSEQQATGQTKEVYNDIKQLLQTSTVPLPFQYLASFNEYLVDIWFQIRQNILSSAWTPLVQDVITFSDEAMAATYQPSSTVYSFTQSLPTPTISDLRTFTNDSARLNAALYIVTIALRESLKGKYLGIKQFARTLSKEEREQFTNFADGLHTQGMHISEATKTNMSQKPNELMKSTPSLSINVYGEMFHFIEIEMNRLKKTQVYLACRVELERYALDKLAFLPSPINSSFPHLAETYFDNPQFSELLYLISEVLPTETPYRLLASSIMKKALS